MRKARLQGSCIGSAPTLVNREKGPKRQESGYRRSGRERPPA